MKKILIVPDSFKGTLTAKQVSDIITNKMSKHFPNVEIVSIPIADGGEGSVECLINMLGGKKQQSYVCGPFWNEVRATWGIIEHSTAIIEIASCAGHIVKTNKRTPMDSTTFGVGELIIKAIECECKKIIVCLGGACTNDAGCGLASAVGFRFLDKAGKAFIPTGKTLKMINKIDKGNSNKLLEDIQFVTLVDVTNPLYGKNGAAYVFAPQKGADEKMVVELDEGLKHVSEVIKNDLQVDVSQICGGGASGGTGAGMVAFLKSDLQMGIDYVIKGLNLEEEIKTSSLIITGEGKVDLQSMKGKAISGIGKCAKKYGIPVIIITGMDDINNSFLYDLGITSIFSINRVPEDLTYDYVENKKKLQNIVENICRLIRMSTNFNLKDLGDMENE